MWDALVKLDFSITCMKELWNKSSNNLPVYCLFLSTAPGSLFTLQKQFSFPWLLKPVNNTVWLKNSHTERNLSLPRLCTPLTERIHRLCFSRKALSNAMKVCWHNNIFTQLWLLSCLCTRWFVCKQRGKRGRDGTNFMDFEALRREPDPSVKIYLSTQKQARESKVRGGKTGDSTEKSMYVQLFKVGQRQQPSVWGVYLGR